MACNTHWSWVMLFACNCSLPAMISLAIIVGFIPISDRRLTNTNFFALIGASEASPTWMVYLRFQYIIIGASAAKPHMDDTSAIFHIIGASAAKPHMDDTSAIFHILLYIYYYRRTSDRSNFALRCSARRLIAHAHRCVKLKQGSTNCMQPVSYFSVCSMHRWHCAKYQAYRTTGILLAKR